MSEDLFSEKIMIYKPLSEYRKVFFYEELEAKTVSEFIEIVKNDVNEYSDEYSIEELNVNRLYIQTADTLFGLQQDKRLEDIFNYFSTDNIQFTYFVVGGASLHCMGYKFIVHPDEDIHRNTPHVHVCKDGNSVRYSLVTLERFKHDSMPRIYARDEKKVIMPYLRENQDKLMGYWNHYINGYTVPFEDEQGCQYYPES